MSPLARSFGRLQTTANTIDRGSVSVATASCMPLQFRTDVRADATTGKILWNFASGGTVIDGPSIVDGSLYWGSGYRNIQGTGNNKVFAFSLAGEKDRGENSNVTMTTPASRQARVMALDDYRPRFFE